METAPQAPATPIALTTPDGYALRVYCHQCTNTDCDTVVISPAMGVPQDFYRPFAAWLNQHGYRVVTFDYRGMEKGTGNARRVQTDVNTWISQDANTVLRWAKQQTQGQLIWLGHSLGSQIVGALPDRELVDHMAGIATGTGYWLHADWALKSKAWLVWWVFAPLMTPLCGYYPGNALKMIGDLPAGVMQQWRRWCLNREYLVGAEGPAVKAHYAAFKRSFKVLSFTDDELMSAQNTEDIFHMYPGVTVTHRRLNPSEVGASRIGHFGFFKPQFETTGWPLALPLLKP